MDMFGVMNAARQLDRPDRKATLEVHRALGRLTDAATPAAGMIEVCEAIRGYGDFLAATLADHLTATTAGTMMADRGAQVATDATALGAQLRYGAEQLRLIIDLTTPGVTAAVGIVPGQWAVWARDSEDHDTLVHLNQAMTATGGTQRPHAAAFAVVAAARDAALAAGQTQPADDSWADLAARTLLTIQQFLDYRWHASNTVSGFAKNQNPVDRVPDHTRPDEVVDLDGDTDPVEGQALHAGV